MKLKLKDIADLVGGIVYGNPDEVISNIAKIEESQKGDLTFLYLPAYEKYLSTTQATAVLIKPDLQRSREDINYIEVKNPNHALQKIIITYLTPKIETKGIDKSAQIDESAFIGKNVNIGKNVVIERGVKIGDNSSLLHNTVVMRNVSIGESCLIYPNVTIREDSVIGNRVIIHSGTVIGSDGFGYIPNEKNEYTKVPQIGNVVLEDDVELGSNVSIDRAAFGSTRIKRGTKIDNLVQVAHNVLIGKDTAIASQCGIAGSSKIGNNVILAGQVGIAGHLEIGDKIVITAQSGVSKSLLKSGQYRGTPAEDFMTELKNEVHVRNLPSYAKSIKNLEEKIAFLEGKISELTKKENI
ncbi:MAG: UDP-3-O-(3-hydroxymyristoyl)glucosamine N-acyltransferase [Melioribacteraceae bacterium]